MTAKHTPGPWHWFTHSPTVVFIDEGDGIVGIAWTGDPDGTETPLEEEIANARLIAAAPEMLEALKSIIRMVEVGERDTDVLRLAWASVDKAEGRTDA